MLIVGRFGNIHQKTSCIPGDTGWVDAGAGATTGPGTAWSGTSNIFTSDNVYATSSIGVYGNTQYLQATNFNLSSIPDSATISQIECRVEAKTSGGFTSETGYIFLVVGGTKSGNASAYILPNTTDAVFTRSTDAGSDPLWGLTPSVAQVKASNFGFLYYVVSGTYPTYTQSVDHMQIKVTWTC